MKTISDRFFSISFQAETHRASVLNAIGILSWLSGNDPWTVWLCLLAAALLAPLQAACGQVLVNLFQKSE